MSKSQKVIDSYLKTEAAALAKTIIRLEIVVDGTYADVLAAYNEWLDDQGDPPVKNIDVENFIYFATSDGGSLPPFTTRTKVFK